MSPVDRAFELGKLYSDRGEFASAVQHLNHAAKEYFAEKNFATSAASGAYLSARRTSGGIGSYGHLWWEMFRSRQQIAGEHVPYNGIAPALKDVIGGQVPLVIDAIVPSGAQVAAGTVQGLAIVAAQRAKSLPNVPTLSEQGYTGFDAAPFYGVLGPAGMDAAVTQKLSATLTRGLATPAVREKLQEMGFDVIGSSPEAYAKLIRDEIERWSKVVKEQNIKVE